MTRRRNTIKQYRRLEAVLLFALGAGALLFAFAMMYLQAAHPVAEMFVFVGFCFFVLVCIAFAGQIDKAKQAHLDMLYGHTMHMTGRTIGSLRG